MSDVLQRIAVELADRYTVQRELGSGGMAHVFLAEDLKHRRSVAIKVLKPELASAVGTQRFLREIEIAGRLRHPHILPLYDSGEVGGLPYYVMPWVAGSSLRERLDREQQLPIDDAVQIARQVADALAYAHALGVVHRDIKPQNILLDGGHALVADFGIARAITEAGSDRLTATGIAVGTPAYMSPEQSTSASQIDGRSDVYSLGCVLYEMLAGEPPFSGATAQAIVARHLSEPPPQLVIVRPKVPEHVLEAVEVALAKVPADRFATAEGLSRALAQPKTGIRARSWVRGRMKPAAMVAVVTVLVAVLWRAFAGGRGPLDPNQIVVFPLAVTGGDADDADLGQSVALALAWALNTTTRLRAVDGWSLLDDRERETTRGIARTAARDIAQAQGAGSMVTGSLLVADSVRLMLDLHDVARDADVRRVLAVGRVEDPWLLGLQAAGELVRALVGGEESIDYAMLSGHTPAALETFLRGEQAYRRAHFREALREYRGALEADSTFALAALRAAQAARWSDVDALDPAIVAALARAHDLPPRYAAFARGLSAYLAAHADTAIAAFRQALAIEPQWHEAWMALGEVYTHLLPEGPPPDSMAEAAFREVRRLEPGFTPVNYHLIEIALRRGEIGLAEDLLRELRDVSADTLLLETTDLMVRCVTGSPTAVDWRAATRRRVAAVHRAAGAFTTGGLRQPACARAGWRALLDHDTTGLYRFGGILGLLAVVLGEQRYDELPALLDADPVFDPALLGDLYLVAATAGAPVAQRAAPWADTLRALAARDTTFNIRRWWILGAWEAFSGHPDQAERIGARLGADEAVRRAAPEDARLRRLFAASLAARAAVARGDSARAVGLLSALTPTGRSGDLCCYPWESLGGERVMLADLLLARGAAAEALRVAGRLDAPGPIPYAMYLPESLEIRERAARMLGYERAAERFAERRQVLKARQ